MNWLAIGLGAVVGAVTLSGLPGVVAGGLIGYLITEISSLKSRLAALEQDAKGDQPHSSSPPASDPTPARPPPPIVSPPPSPPPPRPAPIIPSAPSVSRASAPASPPVQSPTAVDWVFDAVRDFFMGGNTVVRVGIVVLFFGVAFLLKYAAEHAVFSIELRLTATAIGAIVLLYIGARVRRTREAYGLTLEGGAIGILYLTIFAAFRLYGLLPVSLAFGLLLVIGAAAAALALLQNSLALAVLGVTGGFLAPLLASTGAGSHVALFSYYAVLNAGILAIAWFKAWRPLNLLGFGFTFVIGAFWGYRYYQPEFFATTEPFLVLFFLFYVAIAILFARRRAPVRHDPVDATLVFGVPIVAVLMQAGLVRSFEYGMAWSAFALGAFYLALAWFVLHRGMAPLLAETFLALGTVFATLTVPLAVDGHWTAAAWAIEGAGIFWVGRRQRRVFAQVFGLVIQFGAGFFFFIESKSPAAYALLNSAFVGCLLLSLAGLTSAFLLARDAQPKTSEGLLAKVMLAWGLAWWFGGTANEIVDHVRREYEIAVWLALLGATTVLQGRLADYLRWPALRAAALFNLGLLVVAFAWATTSVAHPFAHFGFIAWPFALAAYYRLLWRTDDIAPLKAPRHVGALWLLLALLGWQAYWAVGQWLPKSDWSIAALGGVIAGALWVLVAFKPDAWPVRGNLWAYRVAGASPLALFALGWLVIAGMGEPGNPTPLSYLPLLNPLDITALSLLLALLGWMLAIRGQVAWAPAPMFVGLGAVAFAWVNAALFRALHHAANIPYELRPMLDSMLVQATLSLFWAVLAFTLMWVAGRKRLRYLWMIGAGLLGVVVVKLFLVDLSSSGTIERIVSFVGVGVLLLVIGYLAPVPPAGAAEKAR